MIRQAAPEAARDGMKALVYNRPDEKSVALRPKPSIQAPGDAIIRMVKTTICGTDLHILKGDVATCAHGRILGHEGIGIIDKVGRAISAFHVADHVLIPNRLEIASRFSATQCVNSADGRADETHAF